MKRLIVLPILALAGSLVLALGSLAFAAPAPAPDVNVNRQQWEHLALTQASAFPGRPKGFSQKINELGKKGWELVCVSPITLDGDTTANVYYFKRPL